MRRNGNSLDLSATDLSNFLSCRHRTALDMAAARGSRTRAPKVLDPLLAILSSRGLEHERRCVEALAKDGCTVVDLSTHDRDRDVHVEQTLEAMRVGAGIIVQGALRDGCWFGKPDILRRVGVPSSLGEWSYEVADAKLSRDTKAGTILQLGLYSEMLRLAQGLAPRRFHVLTPYAAHEFELAEFSAYFRLVRGHMLDTVALDETVVADSHYPEPVEHCTTCHWDRTCSQKRRDDDHLSLVAGIARLHRRELHAHGISTLTGLAGFPIPFPDSFRPARGSIEAFVRVREQARIQLESRQAGRPLFELREIAEGGNEGLCRLPEPSPGDIFLDLEGDPFAAEGGREYLFGVVHGTPATYEGFWAFDEGEERSAFERVIDLIMAAWKAHPGMHVYHYAPYEPSTFKRLMGRHVTREHELDSLLRSARFVDLYGVVRQGMRVGAESYSIKKLEPLYGFERAVQLADANRCLRVMEQALELGSPATVPPEVREAVRGYNEDDCISTLRLRDWLEQVRAEHCARGWEIPRPVPPEEAPLEPKPRAREVGAMRSRLLDGVPETRAGRNDEQQARWLLAYLLDYHDREAKSVWWEYFRLRDLPEEDLYDEPQAIAGLEFVERLEVRRSAKGKPTGSVVDRYRYPAQEMECEKGDLRLRGGARLGSLYALHRAARTVDIEKGKANAEFHPTSVFSHTFVPCAAQEQALMSIAERVADDGGVLTGASRADRAGRALLLAQPPQLAAGPFRGVAADADIPAELRRLVVELDHGVLAVQGPPGAGKTYCGAEMICALVAAGRKVGVTASSHKVIRNLLDAVGKAAARNGQSITLAHRHGEGDIAAEDRVTRLPDNPTAARVLGEGEASVVGGTPWLWSHELLSASVDVLFVDEAGQMALANVLAMTPATGSLVLLGDPRQLEQPCKGSHPDGVGVSALEHILRGERTMPMDRGVFLPVTWRMCPPVTAFTSEMFYEGRLVARPALDRQRLEGSAPVAGSGLFMATLDHDGNRTSSMEEVTYIESLIEQLTGNGATWTDASGERRELRGNDVLIVAPYNAQVSRLTERLGRLGARVGTVDKFQGQEAPVVIYSLTTSCPEDAPRGMEFLYSLNRLNVATSRARCAVVVVASGRLLEPECRTPAQMRLANALCRYRELATEIVRA